MRIFHFFLKVCAAVKQILLQDKMRFYKGTDQYVVAVTAKEEVMVWDGFGFGWVARNF